MPKQAKPLTAAKVRTAGPGAYVDGGGLMLLVQPSGAASWILRYVHEGRRRDLGLGPARGAAAIPLAEVRQHAAAARLQLREGVDPIEARKAARAAPPAGLTFEQVAEKYIAAHEATWRNPVHRAQWRSTLETYAYPVIGDQPVGAAETSDVLQVLEPIWMAKAETAARLRGRIEAVLDYAKARGWRDGENPARWRGHLANLLPARSKVARVEHHAALPWQDTPAFMAALRGQAGIGAAALEFAILTAARTGEAIGARWAEIDVADAVWTVPADRMKAGREHRVPLTDAALAVLQRMEALRPGEGGGFVFPGARAGHGLSNMSLAAVLKRMKRDDLTVHGFRSTFRDWAAEATDYAREVAEAALAHTIGDKVEAAYRRGDLFEKRRALMDAWARFAGGGDASRDCNSADCCV